MGIWRAEKTITLDNLTGFWAPDTTLVYEDQREKLGLPDTRTIMHDQRFLLTTNSMDPKVYQVTKVVEVSPLGLYKYSVKQDEYNPKRDNIKLRVCDYYTNMGDPQPDISHEDLTGKEFSIIQLFTNENEELIEQPGLSTSQLQLGNIYYYQAKLGTHYVPATWEIKVLDDLIDDTEKKRLEGLIKLTAYDDNVIAIKPAKAYSLVGKRFQLFASQENGNYTANVEWEVTDNEA